MYDTNDVSKNIVQTIFCRIHSLKGQCRQSFKCFLIYKVTWLIHNHTVPCQPLYGTNYGDFLVDQSKIDNF